MSWTYDLQEFFIIIYGPAVSFTLAAVLAGSVFLTVSSAIIRAIMQFAGRKP